jgi:hypothetical protein
MIIYLKKFLSFIIYNKFTIRYSKNFVTLDNLIFKKSTKNTYVKFLIKNLVKKKIKVRKFKLLYIYFFTLIYELSGNAWNLKQNIIIYNKINKFDLINIVKKLKFLLPTGFIINFIQKKKIFSLNKDRKFIENYKILITSNYSVYLSDVKRKDYECIIFFRGKNCKIYKTKKIEVKNKYFSSNKTFFNKVVSLDELNNNLEIKKQFFKRNYFIFSYKKFIKNKSEQRFKDKRKFRFYNRNLSKICFLKDVVLRFHGLMMVNNSTIKESIDNSWYDENILNYTNLNDYKINRIIEGQCIVLSTGTNNLAHYLFESFTKLYYLKNNKKIKIIINDKISKYIVEILLAFGIKRNQILIKPINENWKIKELIFPSLAYFEISKEESNFLSKPSKKIFSKSKSSYEQVYISRRDATESRNLINEIEIENYLKSKGFKIVLLSKLNLKKKINLLTNAKIIVTPLGAGIQNLYFCKNIKAKVMLIGTNRYFHQKYFLQLSHFKKIKLYFIQALELTSFSRDYGFLHSSFYLNLEVLKSAIKSLK